MKKKNSKGKKVFRVSRLLFALSGLLLASILILSVVTLVKYCDDEDWVETTGKLVEVATPKKVEEEVIDDDGGYHTKTVTRFYGDTVVEYDVDGVMYRAKIKDSEKNKLGDDKKIYYRKGDFGTVKLDIWEFPKPVVTANIIMGIFTVISFMAGIGFRAVEKDKINELAAAGQTAEEVKQ